jgi:hypothetical protein
VGSNVLLENCSSNCGAFHKLRVFENRMNCKGRRKLYNEEFHRPRDSSRTMKSGTCSTHADIKKYMQNFRRKQGGKRQLEKPKFRYKDNIKMGSSGLENRDYGRRDSSR